MKRFLFFCVLLLIGVGIEAKPVAPYLDVGEKFILTDDVSQGVVICEQVAILEFSFFDYRAGMSQIGVDVGEYKLSPILDVQTDGLFNMSLSIIADNYDEAHLNSQTASTQRSRIGFKGFAIGQINRWTLGNEGWYDNRSQSLGSFSGFVASSG